MPLPAILAGILGPAIGSVLDRLIPDPNARAAAKEEIERSITQMDAEIIKSQLQINMAEANHSSMFVAGARPFILWGCGIGFLYMTIVWPHMAWIAAYLGWPAPPGIATDGLMYLLTGVLGLGGYRAVEKIQGVARKK